MRPRLDVLETRQVLSTLVVTSQADSGPGTLRDRVTAAASGDTITFANSLKGQTITLTSGRITDQGKDLSIIGPGANRLTISGGGTSGILGFYATGPALNASVSGLTLANGTDPNSGGAIDASNTNLTIRGDVFRNNATTGLGGAVNDNGIPSDGPPALSVTIADSQFSNNTAGIGGGFQTFFANTTVTNSVFAGNTSQLGGGGTIGYGSGVVSGSTFTNDTADSGGGLVFFAGFNSTLDVSSSAFADDAASFLGGGLYTNGGAVTISDTTFTGNVVTNPDFAQGGGYAATGGTLAIDGSRFEGNSTTSPQAAFGGAVFLVDTGTTSISDTVFKDNLATGGFAAGGAIDRINQLTTFPPQAAITISGSIFEGNRAVAVYSPRGGDTAIGGAVSIATQGAVTITDSTFRDNQAIAGTSTGYLPGLARAGALYVSGDSFEPYSQASLTLQNTNFVGNSAIGGTSSATGGDVDGGAVLLDGITANISGGSFLHNTAFSGDGGSGPNESSLASGGAIASFPAYGTSLTIDGTSFVGNTAKGGTSADGRPGAFVTGGAISGGINVTISNASFIGNAAIGGSGGDATASGGTGGAGGDASGGAVAASDLTIINTRFVDNSALGGRGGSGGANGTGGNGGNAAGGGVFANGPLTVTDSQFVHDLAIGGLGGFGAIPGANGTGYGGAVYSLVGPVTIKRTKFAANRASTGGDDVYGPHAP